MDLQGLRILLPYEEGEWGIEGFNDVEYRSDQQLGWDEFVEEKVKKETGLKFPIRVTRFNFGIELHLISNQKKTRLICSITIAEQNNRFFVYLEDEDGELPDKCCLDLKNLKDEVVVNKILKSVLNDHNLFRQLEERKQNYKFYESFDGVRTFRRLQKFIKKGCPYEKILK